MTLLDIIGLTVSNQECIGLVVAFIWAVTIRLYLRTLKGRR